ncbi:glycosyltransferase family 4 protein [Vibrio sp. 10N.222.54.B6]|uniref:glycosyltransferase family 4 protein n=1 Tax=Vibrio sp. 10N.222.54.B6 TaxID=1884468 RepID=UPI000C860F23|nr:glycosyltransferase family 4 protein [Vibrio sp. 10N.222.54.B6]PMO17535.1 hypothetical protein BCT16_14975 [Vibrio sp. 10N.222.54.B6]
MSKKKVLIVVNRNVRTGPNTIARGMLGYDESSDEFSIEEHCFRNNQENLISSIKRLYKKVFSGGFSIVHTHSLLADAICALLSIFGGFEHIATVHNVASEDYILRYGRAKGIALVCVHYFIFLSPNTRLVCISHTVFSNLPKLLRNKSFVIHNFVADEFFNLSVGVENRLFYCGHFSALKDPTFLIENVKKLDLDFDFELFGDGELLSDCKALVRNDSRFIFNGRSNEVYKYYQEGGLLIHTSNSEGFCLAVAEALASNMKVLVPDLEIFREFSNELKFVNIFFYKHGNKESFSDSLNLAVNTKLLAPRNLGYLKRKRFYDDHVAYYRKLLSPQL